MHGAKAPRLERWEMGSTFAASMMRIMKLCFDFLFLKKILLKCPVADAGIRSSFNSGDLYLKLLLVVAAQTKM